MGREKIDGLIQFIDQFYLDVIEPSNYQDNKMGRSFLERFKISNQTTNSQNNKNDRDQPLNSFLVGGPFLCVIKSMLVTSYEIAYNCGMKELLIDWETITWKKF